MRTYLIWHESLLRVWVPLHRTCDRSSIEFSEERFWKISKYELSSSLYCKSSIVLLVAIFQGDIISSKLSIFVYALFLVKLNFEPLGLHVLFLFISSYKALQTNADVWILWYFVRLSWSTTLKGFIYTGHNKHRINTGMLWFPRQGIQIGCGAHTASCPTGSGISSPKAKRPRYEADNSPTSSADFESACSCVWNLLFS